MDCYFKCSKKREDQEELGSFISHWKPDLNKERHYWKHYHFSGFNKNDVNLVKLIFRLYIPNVITKSRRHFDNDF